MRTAMALPQARTLALAGGGAMIVHGFVTRRQVAAALRLALEEQDLVTHDAQRPPLDHRFVTVDPATGAECTVEVFADGGRLHDRVTLDLGPVLHPDDLAADKMLALWGRARPRDFFDVAALVTATGTNAYLSFPRRRTAGLPARRLSMPSRAISRLGDDDWTEDGINNDDAQRLRATFDSWRKQLELKTT